MVEKAIIENCESHERTVVRFEQVTTIVGPNDVGKSAFLRALWWVVANDPAGTEHIRHGADFAAAALKLDGKWVQRYRSDAENSYTFEGEAYHSLRAPAVPQTISDFLRIGEVNFQWQMDQPFWLVETPGQLSKKLNAVVDLAAIDETLDVARAEVSKAKTKVELAEERRDDLKRRLAHLAWAEDAEAALADFEAAGHAQAEAREQLADLDAAIAGLAADLKTERWLDELDGVLGAAARAATECIRDASDYFYLDKFVTELEAAERDLPPDVTAEWEDLEYARAKGDEAAEAWRELDAHIRDLEESEEKVCRLADELAVREQRLTSETGGRCPACGKATKSSEFLPPTSTSPTPSQRPELKLVRSGFTRKRNSSDTSGKS